LISGASMFLCCLFVEWLELRSPTGSALIPANGVLIRDDALYLMGRGLGGAAGGWPPILVGASVGANRHDAS